MVTAADLDIAGNRRARKYSRAELLGRVAWGLAHPLFRLSPRPFFGWRALLLRAFGARIGRSVHVYPSVRVSMPWNLQIGDWSSIADGVLIYDLGRVTIGSNVTISHGAQLCAGTHDHTRRDLPLLKPPVIVGDGVWICTNAFVGPGVAVGEGAVVAACAVAVRDVPSWTVVAGNPARPIRQRILDERPPSTAGAPTG
jgi:putative colanic acid biosynthesis acetyltransferase WcaF